MSLKSKLKTENVGMVVSFVFYTVVGIVSFAALPVTGFPPHMGVLGILSLMTVYGLFKKRVWALWTAIALFFVATVFSGFMLYYIFGRDLLFNVGIVIYLFLTWVFTAFTVSKRKDFSS